MTERDTLELARLALSTAVWFYLRNDLPVPEAVFEADLAVNRLCDALDEQEEV